MKTSSASAAERFQQNDPHDPRFRWRQAAGGGAILGRLVAAARRRSSPARARRRSAAARQPPTAPASRRRAAGARSATTSAQRRSSARARAGSPSAGASCRAGTTTASASSGPRSCAAASGRLPAGLDACAKARQAGAPRGDAALRDWLQRQLRPYRIESLERDPVGLATGYFEPLVEASRAPRAGFRVAALRAARRPGDALPVLDAPAARDPAGRAEARCAAARSPGCATGSTRCCCRCRARAGSPSSTSAAAADARARRLCGRTTTSRTSRSAAG